MASVLVCAVGGDEDGDWGINIGRVGRADGRHVDGRDGLAGWWARGRRALGVGGYFKGRVVSGAPVAAEWGRLSRKGNPRWSKIWSLFLSIFFFFFF